MMEGAWTLEVPDHALGRAVERSWLLQPSTLIREAHLNLLALPGDSVADRVFDHKADHKAGVYLKAGSGCFVGHFRLGQDISNDMEYGLHFRALTWLHDDELYDNQVVVGNPGRPGHQLADGWFLPSPFFWSAGTSDGSRVKMVVWKPAMRSPTADDRGL